MVSETRFYWPLVLALLSVPLGAAARSGEAEVRDAHGGTPCFTISEQEERRSGAPAFQSITVVDPSSTPKLRMWSMSMPKNRSFPVSFRMCIPYAGRLPVLPQTRAAPLVPGTVYEVLIEARAAPQAPQAYAARFCLLRQRDGTLHVQQLAARPSRRRSACADGA